jgi:hypothetical protein
MDRETAFTVWVGELAGITKRVARLTVSDRVAMRINKPRHTRPSALRTLNISMCGKRLFRSDGLYNTGNTLEMTSVIFVS